jgi:hypothetical protein
MKMGFGFGGAKLVCGVAGFGQTRWILGVWDADRALHGNA